MRQSSSTSDTPADVLAPDEGLRILRKAQAMATTQAIGQVVRGYAEVGSTSTHAAQWAQQGAPHGAVVYAEHQSAGRGRRGRQWQAAPGQNLTFSVVLRLAVPVERLGLLPLAAGLAVHEQVVARVPSSPVTIKWPNDVLIGGQKCCGLLAESRLDSQQRHASTTILGIGLNVNQDSFPEDVPHATSLAEVLHHPVPRAPLLVDLWHSLEAYFSVLERDHEAIRMRYEAIMDRKGQRVQIRVGPPEATTVRTGRLLGVDSSGALRLATDTGIQTFQAGDVTFQAL